MPIFDHTYSKITEVTSNSTEFTSTCKKVSSFHQFILDMQLILDPLTKVATTILPMPTQKLFNKLLIFMICINMQNIRLFHQFVLEL